MDFQGIFWHFKYRRPLAICRMTGVMLLQRHGNGSISRVQFFNSRFEKTRKTLVLMSTLQAWLTIISMTLNRNLHSDTSEILDNEWDHNLYRSCSQGVRNSPSWIVVTHCHNYPPTSSAPHEGTYGSQALIIFLGKPLYSPCALSSIYYSCSRLPTAGTTFVPCPGKSSHLNIKKYGP